MSVILSALLAASVTSSGSSGQDISSPFSNISVKCDLATQTGQRIQYLVEIGAIKQTTYNEQSKKFNFVELGDVSVVSDYKFISGKHRLMFFPKKAEYRIGEGYNSDGVGFEISMYLFSGNKFAAIYYTLVKTEVPERPNGFIQATGICDVAKRKIS